MPKEYVKTTPDARYVPVVRWNPNMDVQIATIDLEAEDGTVSGIYSDLTREGINKLIQVLRRARDAAYGRDQ